MGASRGAATGAAASIPMSRRNLGWRANPSIWAGGPLTPPPVDAVRERLVELGTRAEGRAAALLHRLDPDDATLVPVSAADWPAFAEQLVVAGEATWQGSSSLAMLVDAERANPIGTLPFRLTLGVDCLSFQFDHALADSAAMWPAFLALMHPDRYFGLMPLTAPQGWDPLRSALRHTFGRESKQVRQLVSTVRARRAKMPIVSSGEARAVPAPRAAFGVSPPGFRGRLRGGPEAAGLSVPALLTARAHRVARELGIALHPGVAMVADCRRYLPQPDAYVEGNFVGGSYLDFVDPTDAAEIHRAIQDLLASGRPLLAMTATALLARRGPLRHERTTPDTDGRSLLSLSHVGRMPWPPDGHSPSAQGATVRAIGNHGIAVLAVETKESMTVSVTWADGFQDADLMARFARRLVEEPDPSV